MIGGTPATTAGPARLSGAQRALYLVEQLHPGTPAYNITVAVRLTGPLDVDRLRAALAGIVARHEACRTVFRPGPSPSSEPVPELTDVPVELTVVDPGPAADADVDAAALRLAQQYADEPFDLGRGPLLRVRLVVGGPERHLLVVTVHQLVSDGPSLQVFFDELAAGYAGAEPVAPSLRFTDHAARQRARPVDAGELDWWAGHLGGVPTVLRLPTDRPRPRVAGLHGGNHRHTLPAAVVTPALRLARELQVTPFVLGLTVYGTLLARLAGVARVLVGVPVSARDRPELDAVIGFFATTLPVLVEVDEGRSFAELCRSVQDELLDVLSHQDVTMEQLAERLAPRRDPGHAPLVQAFFSLETDPIVRAGLPGLTVSAIDVPPSAAKVDLDLTLFRSAPGSDDVDLVAGYRTDLFDPATIARISAAYERLLAAAVARPHAPVATLPAVDGVAAAGTVVRTDPEGGAAADTVAADPVVQPDPSGPTLPATSTVPAVPAVPDTDGPGRGAAEQRLTEIWREVLGRDDVGPDDNFFDLGGTSFALATVHSLIGSRLGIRTSLVSLLEFPTVATLARHLDGHDARPGRADEGGRADRLRAGRSRLQQRRSGRGSGGPTG
jgi:acyl carrier protein